MPQAISGRSYNVPVTIGVGAVPTAQRTTTVSFGPGSGGFSITAGDTTQPSTASNPSTPGQNNFVPSRVGDGGAGATSTGTRGYLNPSADFPGQFRATGGTGGNGYEVPWLTNGIGPTLGTGSIFGGGGGGGSLGNGQYPISYTNRGGPGGSGGGGYGGSSVTSLIFSSPTSPSGGFTYPYYYYDVYQATSGSARGAGGGGGSAGFQGDQTDPLPYVTRPGGAGMPGAVIMRYRIAED